jgi:hypothetical protein
VGIFKLHAERNEIMNKAQAGMSKITMPDILNTYSGFDDVQVLVDVGGGYGALLGLITAQHPHIKGINFDLPQVIEGAPAVPGEKLPMHCDNSTCLCYPPEYYPGITTVSPSSTL